MWSGTITRFKLVYDKKRCGDKACDGSISKIINKNPMGEVSNRISSLRHDRNAKLEL